MASTSPQPRVLIVDDTRTNINILVEALRNDYKLSVATGGVKALDQVARNRPDLILLDIMMPEMDGYEVCTRLKAEESTKDIPVIFITALSEIQQKTRGFELGAVDYITKPFEAAEVRARVRTHLQLEEYRRDLEARNWALREAQVRLQHQVRELRGRDRLVRAQMTATTLDAACGEILQVAEQVLGVSQAVVYRPDETGVSLVLQRSLVPEVMPEAVAVDDEASLVARAFAQGQPQDNNGSDAAAVPFFYAEKPLGVLQVRGLGPGEVDRKVLLEALVRLAGEAALVLHAAQLTEDLASGRLQVAELLDMTEDDPTR